MKVQGNRYINNPEMIKNKVEKKTTVPQNIISEDDVKISDSARKLVETARNKVSIRRRRPHLRIRALQDARTEPERAERCIYLLCRLPLLHRRSYRHRADVHPCRGRHDVDGHRCLPRQAAGQRPDPARAG